MSVLQRFEQITLNLPEGIAEAELLARTKEWLNSGSGENRINETVIEEMSKFVENHLRSFCEVFTGQQLIGEGRQGWGLVDALASSGLIQELDNGQPESIHFLLRWYFGERNPSHHEYREYSFEYFLRYYLISNFLLSDFQRRKNENPRTITMRIEYIPSEIPLGGLVTVRAPINNPTDGTPFVRGDVKVRSIFPNGSREDKMSYQISEAIWETQVSTSGAAPGNYRVRIFATGPTEKYVSRMSKKPEAKIV